MSGINFQKGTVQVSAVAAMAIVSAIVAAVSVYATVNYFDVLSIAPSANTVLPRSKSVESPTPSPVPIVDENAVWKNFSNTEGGYSFEYPVNWEAIANQYNTGNSLFGPNASGTSGLGGVEIVSYAGTLESYPKYQEDNADIRYSAKKNIKIDGIDAIRAEYAGSAAAGYAVLLKKDNSIINIYINDKNSDNAVLFDKLAASFSFISTNDETASWKTYTKKDFGFSFKYPSEFILTDANFRNEIYLHDYLGRFGQEIGVFALSKSAYPKKTDLSRADILIAVNRDVSAGEYFFQSVDKNQGVPPPEIEKLSLKKTVVINGITWGMAEKSGAAAGTASQIRIYHTFQNGIWYEVQLNLWTASDGNIAKVNKDDIWNKLESVLPTFKFTK